MELSDTPNLASFYCPGCSPGRDPLEEVLTVRWCDAHQPMYGGFDDERATVSTDILTSTGEAEGVTNRARCEFVHRTAKRSKAAKRSAARSQAGADSSAQDWDASMSEPGSSRSSAPS